MSFNYGNKSRHRTSGRHFKLFSDELPRIEFDRASLEEYNNAANEKRLSKGRRKTFKDSHHDRFSLPSLGTPEWDRLSDTEKTRPQSYSPFNPLNPNFARIHQKIQRRHTLKETKVSEWDAPDEKIRIQPNDNVDKQQYTSAWHEKVRRSKLEKDREKIQTEDNGDIDDADTSAESLNKVVLDKPPVPKKKSLFKELLDASAKENARMNRIKEGLKFKEIGSRRHASVKSYRLSGISQVITRDISQANTNGYKEENSVPEIISESSENTKPGILKHGVRIRETNILKASRKREFPVKPRLIHQEDLPVFGDDSPTGAAGSTDEVRISVHADAPLNRMKDMMFIPLPSTKPRDKQKKVNFHDLVDIKERTAMSELIEVEENGVNLETEIGKVYESEKENVVAEQKRKSVQIRRRGNVRHGDLSKALQRHTVTIKQRHISGDIQQENNSTSAQSHKRYERNVHDDDKQDYIDSILLAKPTPHKVKDLRSKPLWKEARPAVAEVLVHESDPVDAIAILNSPLELTSAVEKLTNSTDRRETRDHLHQPVLNVSDQSLFNTQSLSRSPPRSPRSPPKSPPKSPDLDIISDFTTFFDDELNFDDLPEEIDRSMLGEDLIKAYRFWDRKRKAFPGGLRKIEAPADRHESIYPKQYGNVKTYKITNTRLEKQPIAHAPTHSKPPQGNALMDWV